MGSCRPTTCSPCCEERSPPIRSTSRRLSDELLERLRSAVVVAVVRAPDHESALAGIHAAVAGGIRAVEVTYSTPDAAPLSSTCVESR